MLKIFMTIKDHMPSPWFCPTSLDVIKSTDLKRMYWEIPLPGQINFYLPFPAFEMMTHGLEMVGRKGVSRPWAFQRNVSSPKWLRRNMRRKVGIFQKGTEVIYDENKRHHESASSLDMA